MQSILERPYLILDGGLGTELARQGYDNVYDDQLWGARLLISNPAIIKQAHLNFLEAGADVIETNTYQINVDFLRNILGVDEIEAIRVLQTGVQVAHDAVEEFWQKCDKSGERMKPLVVGSVGPYGAMLQDGSEYSGNYADRITEKELMDWHRPRVKVLVESGVDLLAFETIPCAKEAAALIKLLEEFPSTKAWLSFSCRTSGYTCKGERLSDAVAPAMNSQQILAVGVNCTQPDDVTDCLRQLKFASNNKKLLVYANSGEPWDDELRWHGKDKMALYCSHVENWYDLGARWIGGCCRIEPSDISDIRQKLKELSSQ